MSSELNKHALLSGAFDFQKPFRVALEGSRQQNVLVSPPVLLLMSYGPSGDLSIEMPEVEIRNVALNVTLARMVVEQRSEWLYRTDQDFPIVTTGQDITIVGTVLFQGPLSTYPAPATGTPLQPNGYDINIDWGKQAKKFFDATDPKKPAREVECPGCYGTGFHKGFGGPCRAAGCTAGRR